MTEYKVAWTIELSAPNHRAAAQLALRIQRDPKSLATFFDVTDVETGLVYLEVTPS